jgi:peptidoglycan/LPS O-acetylase OafA/YrhL
MSTILPTLSSRPLLPALTGFRAIAAIMVFLHHYNPLPKDWLVAKMINELHVGVTFFFVLSGFLIAYRYYDNGKIRFRQYMVNRIARIYPLLLLLTTVTFALAAQPDLRMYLYNITFVKGFSNAYKFSGIAQSWSLTVEECFYFLAPVLFLLIKKRKWVLVLFPLVMLGLGLGIVYLTTSWVAQPTFMESNSFIALYTIFGRGAEFAVGIALALVLFSGKPVLKRYKTLVGILACILCIYGMSLLASDRWLFGVFHPLGVVINNLLLPLFGISLIYWGLITERTWLSRFMSSPFMQLLGKSSYAFYLIHMGIIYGYLSQWGLGYVVNFILLWLVSIALYLLVEEPLNRFIRWAHRRYDARRALQKAH